MTPGPSTPSNPFLLRDHPALPHHAPAEPAPCRDAELRSRVTGVLVDGVALSSLLLGPLSVLLMTPPSPGVTNRMVVVSILGGAGVYMAVQAVFITTRGQTLGKVHARTRIVRVDGSRVDFFHGVFLRSWLWTSISQIPLLGALATVANIVAVLGEDRRALHDRLADTRVVDVLR